MDNLKQGSTDKVDDTPPSKSGNVSSGHFGLGCSIRFMPVDFLAVVSSIDMILVTNPSVDLESKVALEENGKDDAAEEGQADDDDKMNMLDLAEDADDKLLLAESSCASPMSSQGSLYSVGT